MQIIPITGEMTDAERQYADLLNRMAEPTHSPDKIDAIKTVSMMNEEDRTAFIAFADAQGERPDVMMRVQVNKVFAAVADVLQEFATAQTDQGPRLELADQVIDIPDVASNIVQTSNRPQPIRSR